MPAKEIRHVCATSSDTGTNSTPYSATRKPKQMTIYDPTDWMPIETAPEGDYILMWVPGPSGTEIRAGYYWGWWECALTMKEVKPIHWMPLPEPPTENDQ